MPKSRSTRASILILFCLSPSEPGAWRPRPRRWTICVVPPYSTMEKSSSRTSRTPQHVPTPTSWQFMCHRTEFARRRVWMTMALPRTFSFSISSSRVSCVFRRPAARRRPAWPRHPAHSAVAASASSRDTSAAASACCRASSSASSNACASFLPSSNCRASVSFLAWSRIIVCFFCASFAAANVGSKDAFASRSADDHGTRRDFSNLPLP
mmetsp:Transcript_24082/g.72394  ORF Transcript_24082/g.72394 Transcript_24082/m.72394 type:complete len:210 (-) Transcript_24082:1391-2020(-)